MHAIPFRQVRMAQWIILEGRCQSLRLVYRKIPYLQCLRRVSQHRRKLVHHKPHRGPITANHESYGPVECGTIDPLDMDEVHSDPYSLFNNVKSQKISRFGIGNPLPGFKHISNIAHLGQSAGETKRK